MNKSFFTIHNFSPWTFIYIWFSFTTLFIVWVGGWLDVCCCHFHATYRTVHVVCFSYWIFLLPFPLVFPLDFQFFSSLHFVLTSLVMTHAQHNKHNTKSHVAEDKTLNNIPLLIWTEMLLLSSCCWLMSSPCLKMLYDIFMRFMAHLRSWWRR